ncbi:NUDIX domain-containing protein [Streptomyces chromofuscus]|uniref:NUDIX domain-containing protein n=1 Tax=Streptomyces chromofuscus TaxID=42881 RepID=UPI00167C2C1D|nr:NUDIX hydrolase [Streptomyces chromofuscus]GGT43214.1 hypothetical protein GCM10010254_73200 [Streptomyces chromofuscus]
MTEGRRAIRVLCTDGQHRLLLMRWRDPSSGTYVWEPPGGGIEPGESPIEAAVRELREETGLAGETIEDRCVMVRRDTWWNGKHYGEEEAFFHAPFHNPSAITRDHLRSYENEWLDRYLWVPWQEIEELPDPVEPPQILGVLRQLAPDGPWAASDTKGRP